MTKVVLLIMVLPLTIGVPAQAATITIGPGAEYDFNTIQAGINAANEGDEVLVAPGEYVITEPITFQGKAITIVSETGQDETTIRMDTPADPNRGSVVIFENNETAESILEGFTITGGKGCRFWIPEQSEFDWLGGGICFVNASSGSVRNCALVQNRTKDAGGGVLVYSSGSSAHLANCIISGNSATEEVGGGVCCAYDSSMIMDDCIITDNSTAGIGLGGGVVCWGNTLVTLTGCTLTENSATGAGGGVYCGQNSSITMIHCTISGNTAPIGGGTDCGSGSEGMFTNCIIAQNTATSWGGGIALGYQETFATISNCTIWGNSAGEGGGGLGCFYGASATVTNSIFWGSIAAEGQEVFLDESPTEFSISYSNIAGGQTAIAVEGGSVLNWNEGNINAEPHFADLFSDNYYLKSQAGRWNPNSKSWLQDEVTSPCIDAGDPDSDWRPELWPHGMRVNMGAYGGTLLASRSQSDKGNIADVNRNAIVDSADICIMVDHWHTDEPYCDIAPAPFGDGIVDVQDLIVVADNLFEDYLDLIPIIAHWKLDETEGMFAADSAGDNDAIVLGGATWQPGSGQIDGALELDGISGYAITSFALNPADHPFSVIAWIKCDTPGQVIVSQQFASNWLATDADGKLMTELKCSDPLAEPLVSETVITDGQWHRIGLVWDGSHRILYVDGIAVAEDAQDGLEGSENGLNIGAGKMTQPGTYFSGLIDDVRIYNRVVSP